MTTPNQKAFDTVARERDEWKAKAAILRGLLMDSVDAQAKLKVNGESLSSTIQVASDYANVAADLVEQLGASYDAERGAWIINVKGHKLSIEEVLSVLGSAYMLAGGEELREAYHFTDLDGKAATIAVDTPVFCQHGEGVVISREDWYVAMKRDWVDDGETAPVAFKKRGAAPIIRDVRAVDLKLIG